MEKSFAISVQNVSKTFKITHEKISTLLGAFALLYKSFDIFDNLVIIKLLKPPAMTFQAWRVFHS